MKPTLYAGLAVAVLLVAAPVELRAHGGQYRGAKDTVPKNPGGGPTGGGQPPGPTTGGASGPKIPTPGRPTTGPGGGPITPTPGPGGRRPRGTPTTGGLGLDLSGLDEWTYWWEFNKDRYLGLKRAIHWSRRYTGLGDDFITGRGLRGVSTATLAPGKADRRKIRAALERVLAQEKNTDIVSSCLIAIAKIGGDASILPLFRSYLPDRNQEKRETAAIAMGIAALEESVSDLLALARDTQRGRRLVRRAQVDFRTRSFACYGLGLITYRTRNHELKRKVLESMKELVGLEPRRARRDLLVAGLQAIRLLRPDTGTDAGRKLRDEAVAFLEGCMNNRDLRPLVRSHAYVAVAALLGRGRGETGARIKERMLDDIANRRQKHWIQQSAVLALGRMAGAEEGAISEALQTYLKRGKDVQAKSFCAIALGQIGGMKNRSFLIGQLRRAPSLRKPWLALGLAVLDHEVRAKDQSYEGDMTAAQAIHKEFKRTKNSLSAAGLAIALGIMKHSDSADDIMDRLARIQSNEEPAGYLAVSLGLMGCDEAKEQIQALADRSTRREKLLVQCSIALGLLGDKRAAGKLVERMNEGENVVAVQSALAQALGFIGDRRSIRPLIELLEKDTLKKLPCAFAAVALGLVGDTEDLPWNSKIAADNNYRANVETLTGNGTGILDIL